MVNNIVKHIKEIGECSIQLTDLQEGNEQWVWQERLHVSYQWV